MTTTEKCEAILRKMLDRANDGKQVTLDQARIERLKRYAITFGAGSAAIAVGLGVCLFLGAPYEPALAALLATSGTLAVFLMKLRDARPNR